MVIDAATGRVYESRRGLCVLDVVKLLELGELGLSSFEVCLRSQSCGHVCQYCRYAPKYHQQLLREHGDSAILTDEVAVVEVKAVEVV